VTRHPAVRLPGDADGLGQVTTYDAQGQKLVSLGGMPQGAGALATFVRDIPTFSHAVGTVRMGSDPATAPLDEAGAFRGVDNLYVTDGSALPRSGGVNPSLTIAANALRTGDIILNRL